jgi:hypothetical protein
MVTAGIETWGEPCRVCGFSWHSAPEQTLEEVRGLPERLGAALAGADGTEQPPGLSWNITAYVSHVADNLRIWAERLEGIAAGAPAAIVPYDQDELAAARSYNELSLQGALWSLDRAVRDWSGAVAATPDEFTVGHPELGAMTRGDVIQAPGHDALHHEVDIRNALGLS